MQILYIVLLLIGIVTFFGHAFLAVHFLHRCKMMGIPYSRRVTSLAELAKDPTNPAQIRHDAKKWFVIPVFTGVITILSSFYCYQSTSEAERGSVIVLIYIYAFCTIPYLIALILASQYRGEPDRPLD